MATVLEEVNNALRLYPTFGPSRSALGTKRGPGSVGGWFLSVSSKGRLRLPRLKSCRVEHSRAEHFGNWSRENLKALGRAAALVLPGLNW